MELVTRNWHPHVPGFGSAAMKRNPWTNRPLTVDSLPRKRGTRTEVRPHETDPAVVNLSIRTPFRSICFIGM